MAIKLRGQSSALSLILRGIFSSPGKSRKESERDTMVGHWRGLPGLDGTKHSFKVICASSSDSRNMPRQGDHNIQLTELIGVCVSDDSKNQMRNQHSSLTTRACRSPALKPHWAQVISPPPFGVKAQSLHTAFSIYHAHNLPASVCPAKLDVR